MGYMNKKIQTNLIANNYENYEKVVLNLLKLPLFSSILAEVFEIILAGKKDNFHNILFVHVFFKCLKKITISFFSVKL